ncbi:uncharacterized protein C20orf96 homolog isoform X2 [Brienomyrus brachyistius]|uniref:uncharacterized protein C20orf96 homolog isoform X2 n=1 Tax=Brienomyrus brachyistius TaxID=42636 RepID=UPI0020B1AC64|nr:uncharacterized protein C20orf96 homolog isoform X2 [Brienomyrus brachyistius]
MTTSLPNHVIFPFKECFQKVDYSRWARYSRRPAPLPTARAPAVPPKSDAYRHRGAPSVHQQNNTRAAPDESLRSLVQRTGKKEMVKDTFPWNENDKILKLLIQSRKTAVEELERHCAHLLAMNCQQFGEIARTEMCSFSCAQDRILQHEKLKRSIVALKGWSQREVKKAKEELEDAEREAKEAICELQGQLEEMELQVVKTHAEVNSLRTYKDRQYHVNESRIAQLRREVEQVKESRKLSSVTLSLSQTMAEHDKIMKETDLHKKVIRELEEASREVEEDIKQLKQSGASVSKDASQRRPPRTHKCTPDMDVNIDIPREEWLPI